MACVLLMLVSYGVRYFNTFAAGLAGIVTLAVFSRPTCPKPVEYDILDFLSRVKYPTEIFYGRYALGAVVFIMMYLVRSLLYRMLLNFSLAARGVRRVKPEAMRAGSHFEQCAIPSCQLAVKEVGLFMNSHLGYGIRVGNIFVVPRHVLCAGRWPRNKLAITGSGGLEIVLEGRMEESHQHDVAYFTLSDSQWAAVGARSGTLLNRGVSGVRVTCTGFEGKSRGFLKKTNMVGQYSYDGSTKAGYSGAAYLTPDLGIVGIHIGVDGGSNIGLSSVLLAMEMKNLCYNESKRDRGVTGLAAYDAPVEFVEPAANWDDTDIADVLYASRAGDQTAYDWLNKNQEKHKVHRYQWESLKNMEPEHLVMFQNVFNQVFTEMQKEKCECKTLQHTCKGKIGKPNLKDNTTGESDTPIEAPQGLTDVMVNRASMLEKILEVGDALAVCQQTLEALAENQNDIVGKVEETEDYSLRAMGQCETLDQRLQSLEIWAIDRGYATLPSFLEEGSPQREALKNRKNPSPNAPIAQKVEGLRLTSQYHGESSSKSIITPPMIRKLRKVVKGTVPIPRELEMQERKPIVLTPEPIPSEVTLKDLVRKESLSDEEMSWLTRILKSRRKQKARKEKKTAVQTRNQKRSNKSTSSCATTSTSLEKSEQSTSSQTGPNLGPGPSTSRD